jgi:site-specific DNA-cytosine methylase
MPDSWLDLEPPLSDSAKYRLCGNAGVSNVVEWIGRRLIAALAERGLS